MVGEGRLLARIVAALLIALEVTLLLGLQMPPNYGPEYTSRFAAMYPKIAKDMNAALLPFMLAGVGGVQGLNQADGIHPTAAGQEIVAKNVLPYLEKVVRELAPKA